MRTSFLVAAALLSTLPACFQFEVTAQAAYAQMAVSGDIGYTSGSGAAVAQDVESALGLGDDQGVPYGRIALDTGVPVIAVSGFAMEDSGTGVLSANFGDVGGILANTPVRSDLELANAKISYAFDISLGPVSLQPGIAANYFDMTVEVADLIGIATETVELKAPLPLGFVRAEIDLGIVSAVGEVGYMSIDVEDVETSFLDLEALLMVHPTPLLNVFVGYRSMELEGEGDIDGDSFDTDLKISGFMVGGGLRF
ncbi:MAG: hypothetical protein JNK15_03995 [Planctomycetes bacterium]|nr:hypothetical protein [Planctomycetota bacterium]